MKNNKFESIADEVTLSLPAGSNLHSNVKFIFETFEQKMFLPLINRFLKEIKEAFSQLDFWLAFVIFDPRKLPQNEELFNGYGTSELNDLISFYDFPQEDTFKRQI